MKNGAFSKSVTYPRLGQSGAQWQEYGYRLLWSFRGGQSLAIPTDLSDVQTETAPSITLSPPYSLNRIEVDGDAVRMVEAGIRRAMVEFRYTLMGQRKSLRVAVTPGEEDILTEVSILHDPGVEIEYRVRWYQQSGAKKRSNWKVLDDSYLFLVYGSDQS